MITSQNPPASALTLALRKTLKTVSLCGLFAVALSAVTAHAATITKADNTTALNLTGSWVGGTVPGAGDIASFDSTITAARSSLLGANTSWLGIVVSNPGGLITIRNGTGGALTLGTSGIDMSAATKSLTFTPTGVPLLILGPGVQTWNVVSPQTLTVGGTGTVARNPGSSLIKGSSSVASASQGTVAWSPAPVNDLVGPWAVVASSGTAANNSVNGYTYATTNVSGNVVPYQGALSFSGGGAWGGISGSFPTVNFDVSTAGTPAAAGACSVNTLRYTGSALTQNGAGLTANGLMNAGTGLLTVGTTPLSIGANSELVLAAMSAGITVTAVIANNGANASVVTVVGNNNVTFSGANSYSGGTFLNSGTLALSGNGTLGAKTGPLTVSSGILDLGTLLRTVGAVTNSGGIIQNGTLTNSSFVANNIGAASVSAVLTGTGTLVKTNAGTLTLSGANTYSGATTVSAGKVIFSTAGSATTAITVASGATNGVVLATAGGSWTNTSSVTQNAGSTLDVEFSSFAPSSTLAPMHVNTLTVNATTTVLVGGVAGNFTDGQACPLVTWASSGPATTNGMALVMPPGMTGHLSITGGNTLNVTADSGGAAAAAAKITFSVSGSVMTLTWGAGYLSWYAQSNAVDLSITNDWHDIPGSSSGTTLNVNIDPMKTNVFYRLRAP